MLFNSKKIHKAEAISTEKKFEAAETQAVEKKKADPNKPKKFRRFAKDIVRNYKCTVAGCRKAYGYLINM